MKTVARRIARLENQFGTAEGKPRLLLVVSRAGWELGLNRDRCVQILGECGCLPAGGVGVVNFAEIPDSLDAEATETFLRENAVTICGFRGAQNDGAGP